MNSPERTSKCHGLTWSIFFIVNLAITFFVTYYVINRTVGFDLSMFTSDLDNVDEIKGTNTEADNQDFHITMKYLKRSIKFAVVATVLANLLHLFYIIAFPKAYVHVHLFLSLIYSLIPAICLFLPQTYSIVGPRSSLWGAVFSLVFAGLGIWSYRYLQKFVDTSAELLKTAATLLKKHPSLLLVEIIQSFVLLSINIIYMICITAIQSYSETVHFNPLIYVYGVFSYYWIIMTVYYTCYMTITGVIGYEFYHQNTGDIPNSLVFSSFKKAITTNFGSAVFAGFILAIIQTLEFLVEFMNPERRKKRRKEKKDKDDDDEKEDNAALRILLYVLYVSLNCVLSILKSYYSYMSRQALIYCSIFDCSYQEGCTRFQQKGFLNRINKLQHESIVSGASGTNYLLFAFLAGVAVYYGQLMIFHDEVGHLILSVTLTEVLMFVFYTFTNSLITTSSDTLFLCYMENPSTLYRKDHELYSKLEKVKYE